MTEQTITCAFCGNEPASALAYRKGLEAGIKAYRHQVTEILKLTSEVSNHNNTKITLNGLVAMINTPKEQ